MILLSDTTFVASFFFLPGKAKRLSHILVESATLLKPLQPAASNANPDQGQPLLSIPSGESPSPYIQELTDKFMNGESLEDSDIFSVLASWCNTCTVQGAEMVETLLSKLPQQELTRRQCTLAVEAWSKAGNIEKAREALEWMQSLAIQYEHLAPSRIAYKYLMEAHLRVGQLNEAKLILLEMESSNDSSRQPLTFDYNLLLLAFARIGAATEAEGLLKRMVDRCKQMESNLTNSPSPCPCAPDTHSYYFLLNAHAQSNNPQAGTRAMEILNQISVLSDRTDSIARPNARMYTSVIQAIARNNPRIEEVVVQVESLFEQAKSRGIKPDKYLYNAVLDVHANNDAPGSVQRAEDILKEITAEGILNDVAYNTVLKAWKSSRHPDACERSLAILKYMEEHQLASTVSYTTVIGTLAIKGSIAAAQYANNILENMQREYKSGNLEVQPDQQTYNSLLNAWVRCGETRRAEKLLRMMEQNNNDTAIASPSVITYSTVMSG
jgi:pentatricopeptide repeat protein